MLQTSAAFRSSNQILFSATILRGAEATKDYSMEWGSPHSTGPTDVIDLNKNGEADFTATSNFHRGDSNRIAFSEPAIASPSMDRLEQFAKKQGVEVLTQSDLPQGVFVHDVACEGVKAEDAITSGSNLRPLNTLVNDLPEEFDPAAQYALDFANNEFLIFLPQQ